MATEVHLVKRATPAERLSRSTSALVRAQEPQDSDSTPSQDGRGREMNSEFTAVIKQDGEWWIGWIEEVPGVNCQEATREELIDSLTATLREALDLNREDALAAAGDRYTEAKIAV